MTRCLGCCVDIDDADPVEVSAHALPCGFCNSDGHASCQHPHDTADAPQSGPCGDGTTPCPGGPGHLRYETDRAAAEGRTYNPLGNTPGYGDPIGYDEIEPPFTTT